MGANKQKRIQLDGQCHAFNEHIEKSFTYALARERQHALDTANHIYDTHIVKLCGQLEMPVYARCRDCERIHKPPEPAHCGRKRVRPGE